MDSLLTEEKVYKRLTRSSETDPGHTGIIDFKVKNNKGDKYVVMDLLGDSLEKILSKHKKFSLLTVIVIAIQTIHILRKIHEKGFIHRDIKPDNFVIDTNSTNKKIFCIDFGLAKKYKERQKIIPFTENKKFCGTARYASIAAHNGHEQSPKDDLESIGYLLVYFYKGRLPWQGINHEEKEERYRLIGEKKKNTTPQQLCKGMPDEFVTFFQYIKLLDYDEIPDYDRIINMFKKLYFKHMTPNAALDWERV